MKTIVNFPQSKIVRNLNQRLTKEEHEHQQKYLKKVELETLIDDVMTYFFAKCSEYNIPPLETLNDDNVKQISLVIESMRSLLWGFKQYEHPLQKTSLQLFHNIDGGMQLVSNTAITL